MLVSPTTSVDGEKGVRMLILLGGAPRAGKGIISRRLVRETAIPLLTLDTLKMGLHHAVPSLGVDPNASSSEVGERMWPLVRAMAKNALESKVDYVFEGDMLLPQQAAELCDFAGKEVRSCFVGYVSVEPRQKLAEIREHAGFPNDWVNEHSDEDILDLIEYGIQFSRELSEKCSRVGLRYFDGSADFVGTVDAVVAYLSRTSSPL